LGTSGRTVAKVRLAEVSARDYNNELAGSAKYSILLIGFLDTENHFKVDISLEGRSGSDCEQLDSILH